MNRRDRYRMAEDVATIRRLRLERARLDVSVSRMVSDRADGNVVAAEQEASVCIAGWQSALGQVQGLDTAMIRNWMDAAAAATRDVELARDVAREATLRLDRERIALGQLQQHLDGAEQAAGRARTDLHKQLEEKQLGTVGDMFLARGGTP